jgi:2-dehydro-3-deoxyphosphogluconate aldolase/(4S)-4-hydroxy-2-oxoglutarate aldolase
LAGYIPSSGAGSDGGSINPALNILQEVKGDNMTNFEWVCQRKIIAIVRGLASEHMLRLAEVLHEGGIDLLEVTFDQAKPETWKDTAAAVRAISEHMANKMLVGAGTVITEQQLGMAYDAGAQYIITPNTNSALIRKVKQYGLLSFPGAFTPSEIAAAWDAGADAVKVFPASILGTAYIKAVRAPLSNIPLMAVGGVNEKNAAEFIAAGCFGVGVGGNLVNKDWIEAGKWDKITALAHEYRKAVG